MTCSTRSPTRKNGCRAKPKRMTRNRISDLLPRRGLAVQHLVHRRVGAHFEVLALRPALQIEIARINLRDTAHANQYPPENVVPDWNHAAVQRESLVAP